MRSAAYAFAFASMVVIGRIPTGTEGVWSWPKCIMLGVAATLVVDLGRWLDRLFP